MDRSEKGVLPNMELNNTRVTGKDRFPSFGLIKLEKSSVHLPAIKLYTSIASNGSVVLYCLLKPGPWAANRA